MLIVDGYQGDWQLQLQDDYHAVRRWLIISPAQPTVTELAQAQHCVMDQQITDYQWLCATATGLWLLQREQQQWWLTFWPQQQVTAAANWLGTEISRHHTELFELTLFDSTYSGLQLLDYSKFKWGQRQPLLREIGHGQYHIQLHQPLEDLFVLQQSAGSLVFQFRAKTPTRGSSGY